MTLIGMAALVSLAMPQSAAPDSGAARRIPFDAGWELSGEGARIETYHGNRALRLRSGRALRRDVSFQDGTVEFDVEVTPYRSFVYFTLRMEGDDEYEELYLRPHKSSLPDALQYSPVWRGVSNWQLYHGPGATARTLFPHGEWLHVRLVVQGRRAALFLGDGDEPAMLIPLGRDPAPGYIAFGGFTPPGSAPDSVATAAFANVAVRPGDVSYRFPPAAVDSAPAGLVRRWQLSPPFAARGPVTQVPDHALAERAGWPSFAVEPTGILVVDRHLERPDTGTGSATVARLVLRAEEAGLQRLHLGYSDYVTVFIGGRPIFAGDAHYSFDRPRQEGLIGISQATLWLPLVEGDNEVLLALSDGFGGWGLTARLDPADGARVVAPAR